MLLDRGFDDGEGSIEDCVLLVEGCGEWWREGQCGFSREKFRNLCGL